MSFLDFLQENIVYLDGGMGTLLQGKGLRAGEQPERWNLTHADVVTSIHKAYFDAGSNVICANTFGANLLKFPKKELEEIIQAALFNAKKAREESASTQAKFIALDIGPSGKLLKPYGDLDFEDAVSLFAETVRLGVKYGAELIFIETFSDSYETKAAVLAAKENSNLPVLVCNAYGEDGKLLTGATPTAMAAMLEGLGVDALGANCSLGPKQLAKVAKELVKNASLPVILKPNAGLPKAEKGKTVFDVDAEAFSTELSTLIQEGVRVVGGCCGTTPAYIQALVKKTDKLTPAPLVDKNLTVVSSYTHAVAFDKIPVLIGERINPTGKKRFRQALIEGDISYVLNEGVTQAEKGAHILDVNVGIPDVDEKSMLSETVCALQSVIDLPLQIDTSNIEAMELALRRYNGKAMINSVNGKKESMEAVFPLAKKYGGVIVALTLDEGGIPQNEEGRYEIARKILDTAASYGIAKKDIVFDTLAMTISADAQAAVTTLKALKRIKEELGCHTSLGVSNVSFGLPNREVINAAFFALALENGLSAAIMNPYSMEMMRTYYAYKALKGKDKDCEEYLKASAAFGSLTTQAQQPTLGAEALEREGSPLQRSIMKGFKEQAGAYTRELLTTHSPMQIINEEIIPALDKVGVGFEKKQVYLPQLLTSAEAAKSAFEEIKLHFLKSGGRAEKKAVFVLATVHGDIHDIGKNIVKLLMENYGYEVVDLGKDVPPEQVVKAVVERHAPLVGLSALMTTTVPAMERTIRLLREQAPWCKIIVGGAVLTEEYAEKIGADKYAKDALEAVRYAENLI